MVMDQLAGIGSVERVGQGADLHLEGDTVYDIQIIDPANPGNVTDIGSVKKNLTADQVINNLDSLYEENRKGKDVLIRAREPEGGSKDIHLTMSASDGPVFDRLDALKQSGFEPSVVVMHGDGTMDITLKGTRPMSPEEKQVAGELIKGKITEVNPEIGNSLTVVGEKRMLLAGSTNKSLEAALGKKQDKMILIEAKGQEFSRAKEIDQALGKAMGVKRDDRNKTNVLGNNVRAAQQVLERLMAVERD
jgi:hypothetical protein